MARWICIPISLLISHTDPMCVVYKSQAPGICPEKDLDRNGVWVRVLILFSSMLLRAMAVLMQWQGSLKLWLYETKANFLSFVHYRERLPAGRKACCANYSIHESSLKYVMDFTGLFTGKQADPHFCQHAALQRLYLLHFFSPHRMEMNKLSSNCHLEHIDLQL